MQGSPWIIIVDFSYIRYVSKLPGYKAIVNFQIRSKSFKKFLGRLKGYIVNARISVKISIVSKLCFLSYKFTYVSGYQATHFVGLFAA